jgi:tRNA (uracil-5-)-methyltransferase TRM9
MDDSEVKNTYEQIASHFSETRHHVWPPVKKYIDSFESNSLVADIGCGNGKNMYREDCSFIGLDFCLNFTKICYDKGLESMVADNLNLPFKDNLFDYTMSVAVIHHLDTEEKRLRAIKELIRITKLGGKIFISVWALKQPENSKRKFTQSDNMVEWNKYGKKFYRFYHIFEDQELYDLCSDFEIEDYTYSAGNWSIVLIKN